MAFKLAIIKRKNKIVTTKGTTKKAGRDRNGSIRVRHQGGGRKQLYREIDWAREDSTGIVSNFEYDPNRSARIARVYHFNKNGAEPKITYILAPKGLKLLSSIHRHLNVDKDLILQSGDCTMLENFDVGDLVNSVQNNPGGKAIYARAAGTFCQILEHNSDVYAKVRLPSGSQRLIPLNARATYGMIGNEEHNRRNLEKAGRSRWLNRRPSVRGVAMNPVDHPHGGGHGKTRGGRLTVSPWARLTKGKITRNVRKRNRTILTKRIKSNKNQK